MQILQDESSSSLFTSMATINFILELIKQKLQKQQHHHQHNKTTYTKISLRIVNYLSLLIISQHHLLHLHLQTQLYITSTTTFNKSLQHEINFFKRPYPLLYRICICATRHDVPDSSPAYGTVCNPVFSKQPSLGKLRR